MSKQSKVRKGSKRVTKKKPTGGGRSRARLSSPRPLKGLLTRKVREAQARKLLLFLSTGNTCRSPMAVGYFKKLLEERKIKNIEIRSAGVMTIAGLLATDESKLMLDPYGVSLDKHRSQPLTEEMIRRVDMILGMTPFHVQMSLRLSPAARGKTFLLKEYTRTDPKNRPIPDPMGCTLEVYKRCFRQIKQACDRLIEMEFVTGKPARKARAAAAKVRTGAAAPSKLRSRPTKRPTAVRAAGTAGAACRSSGRRKSSAHSASRLVASSTKTRRRTRK